MATVRSANFTQCITPATFSARQIAIAGLIQVHKISSVCPTLAAWPNQEHPTSPRCGPTLQLPVQNARRHAMLQSVLMIASPSVAGNKPAWRQLTPRSACISEFGPPQGSFCPNSIPPKT